jgi:hypothetical protein
MLAHLVEAGFPIQMPVPTYSVVIVGLCFGLENSPNEYTSRRSQQHVSGQASAGQNDVIIGARNVIIGRTLYMPGQKPGQTLSKSVPTYRPRP